MYPVIPNTTERDLQTSLQNYNNLLEQQIFEEDQEQDVAHDESRNLSLQNGASRGSSGFQMKENRGDQANMSQSFQNKPLSSGALGGKLFKFKKNNPIRDSAQLLGESTLSGKNPFTSNILNLEGDNSNQYSTMNPFAPRGRKIAERPYKVLDAPALSDDFYLNLVDWSH